MVSVGYSTRPGWFQPCDVGKMEMRRCIIWGSVQQSILSLVQTNFDIHYIDYWSKTLSSNMKDPSALWSKISPLLNQPNAKSDCKFSADEFADHFQNKVTKSVSQLPKRSHRWFKADPVQCYRTSDQCWQRKSQRSSAAPQRNTVQ